MSHRAFFLLLALTLAGCLARNPALPPRAETAGTARSASKSDIHGAWKVLETAARTPGDDWVVRPRPEQSLYVFTERHYSYMYTFGVGPRPRFAGDPNRPTEAEKAAAYDSFIAGAGTYTLAADSLTLDAVLRRNPNEMTGLPLRYQLERSADTLRLTIVNPPFLPGREWRTVLIRIG
ncbi:MAG: hypothetical protein ACR2G6_01005 [Gemmatimonadaceae bacterium]